MLALTRCYWCVVLALLGWAAVSANALANDAPPALTPEQTALLDNGQAWVEVWKDKTRDDGAIDVIGGIDVAAPRDIVWAIMLDCDKALKIVRSMRSCDILESDPAGLWDIRAQKMLIAPFLPKPRSVFRADYTPPSRMDLTLAPGGDMKVQEGYWAFYELGEGHTRVMYRAALRPNFPVPGGILRNSTRKAMPKILHNLRDMAEAEAKALRPEDNVGSLP